MSTLTVHIAIGNSDDKLSQRRWVEYCTDVHDLLKHFRDERQALIIHGVWHSNPISEFQNACFCIEIVDQISVIVDTLKEALSGIAAEFEQDSIAWAETPETVFVKGV